MINDVIEGDEGQLLATPHRNVVVAVTPTLSGGGKLLDTIRRDHNWLHPLKQLKVGEKSELGQIYCYPLGTHLRASIRTPMFWAMVSYEESNLLTFPTLLSALNELPIPGDQTAAVYFNNVRIANPNMTWKALSQCKHKIALYL